MKRKLQTYLAAGQSDFDMFKCLKCGLRYSRGLKSDEKSHRAYCARNSHYGQRCRIDSFFVGQSKDKSLICYSFLMPEMYKKGEHGKILGLERFFMQSKSKPRDERLGLVKILKFDVASLKAKRDQKNAVEMVNLLREQLMDSILGTQTLNIKNNIVFVAVQSSAKKVIGASFISKSAKSNSLSVNAIWVDKSYRRQNVATHLIDAARKHAYACIVVPKSKTSFAEPTDEGTVFWKNYLSA